MAKPKFRIKCDDTVVVTAGKDKGKIGRVLNVLRDNSKIVVEGVAKVKRHQKPVGDNPGAILEKESPIHISNVALWDADAGQRIKVGYKVIDGKKVRVNRKTGDLFGNA
jgi:large subunit ribosomal protein L24